MKNKKHFSVAVSFLLLVILVGCEFQTGNFSPSLVTHSPTALEVTQVLATIPPATNSPLPTFTATPVPTATESQNQALQGIVSSSCLPVQSGLPKGTGISGSMFAMHYYRIYYIYDIASGVKREINFPKDADSYSFSISPNGSWFAYNTLQDVGSKAIVITPASNILGKSYRKNVVWTRTQLYNFEGWLDNNQLIVTRALTPTSLFSTLIVNPFTGQEHEFFLPDYPGYMNFATSSTAPYYYQNGNVVPDPTLSRLVYPKFVNGEEYDVLWDLESKTPLAQLRDLLPNKHDPLWSPDGSDFIIPAPTRFGGDQDHQVYEWFSVTKDGQVRQLTHFGDFLSENYILGVTRSPDGRYLAFQMNYQEGSEHGVKFFVLDLQQQNLGAFCVDSLDISGGEPKPVWSPDSKYVLLSNSDENDDENVGGLILVDIAAKQAYEIAKGIHAVGWLANPETS